MQNSEKLSCLPIAYREPAPVRGGGTTCNKDFIPRALSTVSRLVVGPDVRSSMVFDIPNRARAVRGTTAV